MLGRVETAAAFVADCAGATEVDVLIARFQALIGMFDFDVAAGGCWTGLGSERRHRFFFNTWPADWQAYYRDQGFFQRDFVVDESRLRIRPFTWAEMPRAVFDSPGAREFVRVVHDRYHWVDGFVVPIKGPNGFEGIVSLAATASVALDPTERSLLEVACRAIHERCRLAVGLGAEPPGDPSLTPREIECMKWVATGKSDWQAGELLGISASTVHFHVEQTKKKLGVRSRVQAVAVLVLHGLI